MTRYLRAFLLIIPLAAGSIALWPVAATTFHAEAQEARVTIRGTGQPLPRFMTLKSDEVNMRTGPGFRFPITYVYTRKGLPVEVVREFDVWREVIDHEGERGWMHSSTLSLKRMGLVMEDGVEVLRSDDEPGEVVALAEKGAVVRLPVCGSDWCRIEAERIKGWIQKRHLWGVFEAEEF